MASSPPAYQHEGHSTAASSAEQNNEKHPSQEDIQPARPEPPTTNDGLISTEQYVSEAQRSAQAGLMPFRIQSLWEPAVINPVNGKSFTLPMLRFWDPYSIAFWMATLGFFSAFFSWFAFAPLMPEAVKADLKLSQTQILNSNLASLGGTAIVRFFAGAMVDRFGPRKVMAILLCLGAIPSALVPTVSNIGGLDAVRFFISILGGTFVPTQAWTTTFFDKTVVGTANAFSGGWGNLGGGVTPAVMIGIFNGLVKAGLRPHLAWRVCFLVLPVPLLFSVALLMMIIGKDHPAGKWSQRHQLAGTAIAVARGEEIHLDHDEQRQYDQQRAQAVEKGPAKTSNFRETMQDESKLTSVDLAVSEPLTVKSAIGVLTDLRVWMVAFSYLATFGLETALDAAFPTLINTLFASPTFGVTDAAYVASTYGLCNLYARPFGGIFCDWLYRKYRPHGLGVRAKVIFLMFTGLSQGALLIGLGVYIDRGTPSLGAVIGFIVAIATVGFAANGAAYAIYGHLRPKNVGFVAGIVGGFGNIGGLVYTGIFLHLPGTRPARTLGRKFWVAGIVNLAVMLPGAFVPLRDAN